MNNSIKSSVSTSDIFWFSIRDIRSDPYFFFICLFPIYLLIAVSHTFNDIIIVYNDFGNWQKNYQSKDFVIGLIYVLLESYVLGLAAIIIHNKVIKKKLIINFFSKELFIYAVFYLVSSHARFLIEVSSALEYLEIVGIIIFIFILFSLSIITIVIPLTIWFWFLYLPNIAVRDGYSFVYIWKNSKGARLTFFFQIFYFLIFIIPGLIIYFLSSNHFTTVILFPIMILFGIVMLSNTYLEWLLLEKNRK